VCQRTWLISGSSAFASTTTRALLRRARLLGSNLTRLLLRHLLLSLLLLGSAFLPRATFARLHFHKQVCRVKGLFWDDSHLAIQLGKCHLHIGG
jgi:hypothetical protein